MPKSKAAPAEPAKKTRAVVTSPTYEEIALRAYHIYLERGCTSGDPMQDWLRAEQELLEAAKKPKRKSTVVSIAA
ncbi:MAG TPA: DUF2934 domain-containing protein [Candidatus Sulfotelmatobacter sp.]|nr:DUF2934 domain-containing protein [Candidatus Sulfotelmatobacter sp.]